MIKNVVEPITAANPSIGSIFIAYQTMVVSMIETMAKNHAPCAWKNRSPLRPKFFGSRKSQLRKRKIKNTPPDRRRIGDVASMAAAIFGSLEKAAVNTSIMPIPGFASQTMTRGKRPLTTNTAKKNPHRRNHRCAFLLIPPRTSALIMALSILVIISKRERPRIVRMIAVIFICMIL